MGRELRRVPLDFKWPLEQVWEGYINPYSSIKCSACDGRGLNEKTRELEDSWYSFDVCEWVYHVDGSRYNKKAWSNNLDVNDVKALLDGDRLWDFTRVPITDDQKEIVRKKISEGGNSWLPYSNGRIPTPEEVNEWNTHGLGHDSINRYLCVTAKAKRLGFYGHCKHCNGEGVIWHSEEIRSLSEDWNPYAPPVGEGFQLWETTSEGSPCSPVFDNIDSLCEWCADNATTFGSHRVTSIEWRKMLDNEFVCHKEGNMVFI